MSTYRLRNLFSPRSVALVAARVHRTGHKAKFKGEFALVNAHYAEIDGVGTVGSLDKLPFVPELVVIAAPATAVVGIIEKAGKRGVAGALIVTAGLSIDRADAHVAVINVPAIFAGVSGGG